MADETYGPKPDPGARMVSWPTLIAMRAWEWLSWPWQVREMKRYGFRRVGWMTWETGPPDEAALDWEKYDQVLASTPLCPVELEPAPWADPEHDVMADIREAMQLVDRMPLRRILHCAENVITALRAVSREAMGRPAYAFQRSVSAAMYGIDLIVEHDWEPGRWELREGDTVIDSGRLEEV